MSKVDKNLIMRGKCVLQSSIASATVSQILNLQPGAISRLASVQNAYEFYRFTKVRARVVAPDYPESSLNTTGNHVGAVGYYPEETKSTATTINWVGVASLACSRVFKATQCTASVSAPGYTVPITLTVPSKVLMNQPVKWYRTNSAGAENAEIVQGCFIFSIGAAPSSTMWFFLELDYEIEFCGQVDATSIV
jgi:uncharacterized protein YfaS (alpha-2-macroglobulin family)